MFDYPDLVRLSIGLCIALLALGYGLWRKWIYLSQYSMYFVLLLFSELLRLTAYYLENGLLIFIQFVGFCLFLFIFISYSHTLKKFHLSSKFCIYSSIATFLIYPILHTEIIIKSYYFLMPSLLIMIIVLFFIFVLVFAPFTAYLEQKSSLLRFSETFSFVTLILTPITLIFAFFVLQIIGATDYVWSGKLQQEQIINKINVGVGGSYLKSTHKDNEYIEISAPENRTIQWNNMQVVSLESTKRKHYRDKRINRGKALKEEYLEADVKNHQLVHNRLCSKYEPLRFRFLSENYSDWSEQNTEFMSCELVADSPLNKMRILQNLGDKITLNYKPLQNDQDHPKKLYQDLVLLSEIKWHWKVNKKLNLYSGVNSSVTDLYLDNNRHLIALVITNEIEEPYRSNIQFTNECVLSPYEFSKMLVLDVGNNSPTAHFVNLAQSQKCTPKQLEFKINREFIFDYSPSQIAN